MKESILLLETLTQLALKQPNFSNSIEDLTIIFFKIRKLKNDLNKSLKDLEELEKFVGDKINISEDYISPKDYISPAVKNIKKRLV